MDDDAPPTKKSLAGLGDLLKKIEKAPSANNLDPQSRTIEAPNYTITYRRKPVAET